VKVPLKIVLCGISLAIYKSTSTTIKEITLNSLFSFIWKWSFPQGLLTYTSRGERYDKKETVLYLEERIRILMKYLLEKVQVSALCDPHGLHRTILCC